MSGAPIVLSLAMAVSTVAGGEAADTDGVERSTQPLRKAVTRLLNAPDGSVRVESARALANEGSRAALPALKAAAVTDRDASVRRAAADAYAAIAASAATPRRRSAPTPIHRQRAEKRRRAPGNAVRRAGPTGSDCASLGYYARRSVPFYRYGYFHRYYGYYFGGYACRGPFYSPPYYYSYPCYGYDPTYYLYRRLARRQYNAYRWRCYWWGRPSYYAYW